MSALTFTVLDLRALRPYSRSVVVSLLVSVLIIVLPTRSASGALPAMFLLAAAVGPQYPFSLDERGRLDLLHAALPVTRRTVVLGRYLTILVIAAGLGVVGLAVTLGAGLAFGTTPEPALVGPAAAGGFALFCLMAGIQMPFFYALGFARARPYVLLGPMAAFPLGWIAFRSVPDPAAAVERLTSGPVLAGLVAAGLAALAVSAAVSVRVYERRDL